MIQLGDESFTMGGVEYPFLFPETGGNLGARSISPFAPKSATGDRSYQDYEWISATALADLTGGMGQDRLEDATRYYAARNVDARGGRLVLGPLLTTTSISAGLSTTAAGLLDGSITGLTLMYLAVDSTRAKAACRVTIPADVSTLRRVWLPLSATVAASTVTVGIYSDSSGSPGTLIDSTTLSRDEFRAWGGWTQAVFASDVAVVGGDDYWISVEHSGAAGSVAWYGGYTLLTGSAYANARQWSGAAWTSTTGSWHLLANFDQGDVRPDAPAVPLLGAGEDGITRLWAWAGRSLYYVTQATGGLTPVTDGAGNTYVASADIAAVQWFRGATDTYSYLYVALGDSTDMVRFDGNIGTEQWTAVTSIQARALAVHNNLLWRADERNQVSGSANGTTFGAAVAVGDTTYPVVKMLSWNGVLIVGKQDGLYKVEYETGYPTSTTPTCTRLVDFAALVDAASFSVLVEHQGSLIFNIGQALLLYTIGSLLTPITPDSGLSLAVTARSYYRAAFSALSGLWVWAEGPLGGDSALLAYVDGHWHPIATLPRTGDMVRGIYLEPGLYSTTPRLWYSAGLDFGYALLPATTQKRWLWADMTWAVSGYLDTSWIDGGIRSINKDWYQVTLHVQQVSPDLTSTPGPPTTYPGAYVTVHWRYSETAAWVAVGGKITTSGITTLAFPAGSYSPKLQLRITLYRGVYDRTYTVSTPQVEAIVIKHIERPEEYRTLTRTYEFGSQQTWRNGLPTRKTLGDWLDDLRALREAAEPVTLTTWYGRTYSGHIVDYDVREVRQQRSDGQDYGSMLVVVRFQELV